MTTDDLFRTAAVGMAAALILAPYWEHIRRCALRIAGAAKANRTTIARLSAAGLLIAAAWGKVPLPSLGTRVVNAPVSVERPDSSLRDSVSSISEAMSSADMPDRLLWAALWTKAAKVVQGDAPGEEQIVPDTKSLREFNVLTLEVGWKRIGGHKPGQYVGLRSAVEKTLAEALGMEQKPLDAAMRSRVVDVYKAIAWAGMNRE